MPEVAASIFTAGFPFDFDGGFIAMQLLHLAQPQRGTGPATPAGLVRRARRACSRETGTSSLVFWRRGSLLQRSMMVIWAALADRQGAFCAMQYRTAI